MSSRALALVVLSLLLVAVTSESAVGQYNNPARRTANWLIQRPTVSPYLNLLMPQGGGLPNYQTLVRPQLEQQKRNQETQRQIAALQSAVATSSLRDQRGESTFRGTGHPTAFLNNSHFYASYYSHYFPAMSRRRR